MKRNPVVRDLIAKPRRNAGKHSDKRAVMIEDLTNVRAELEQEMRELCEVAATHVESGKLKEARADLDQLKALIQKAKQVQFEIEEFDDEQ